MRNSILSLILITFVCFNVNAGTTQDTIDNPYWRQMMNDKNANFYQTVRAYNLYFSNKPKAKGTGFKQFERWAFDARNYVHPDGTYFSGEYLSQANRAIKSKMLSTRSNNGTWSSLGPFTNPTPASLRRQVGRINCVAFHPSNTTTLYAGAPAGGFWYSTNNGGFWKHGDDNMESLGVSDILVHPTSPNIIFIATGDRDGQRNPPVERGVMKSTNSGLSFSQSNTGMGYQKVNKLAMNALNPNTIIAATEFGIYVSRDLGANWSLKSPIAADFKDLKYCPNDTMVIYATTYDNGSFACNFYKSSNGGNTWTLVNSGMSSATNRCRMEIAVTAHNPNIVYLVSAKPGSKNFVFDSLYKSSDKGTTFRGINPNLKNILGGDIDGNSTSGQGWYDIAMISSPTDSNFLLVGGVNTFRSTNGGSTWAPSSSWYGESGTEFMHADVHYFARSPHNGSIYVGHDGGVDVTADNGINYTSINDSLTITQIYNLGVSQKSKRLFIVGTQDNGTSLSSSTLWKAQIGGDGMHCDISNLDTTKMVGSLYFGRIFRTTDNGANWNDLTSSISESNTTGPWVSPMHLHPRINNILVAGLNNAWISKNIFGGSPTFSSMSSLATSMQASAVRFSNINDSLVFIGWIDGTVRYCSDIFVGSPSLTNCGNSFPGSSGNTINDIETSHHNKDVLWVARGNRIYRSANRGGTWTNITANLASAPYDVPILSIVADKNMSEALYVGTAIGVFYKDSAMTNWLPYINGLPATGSITDLEIVYDTICSSSSILYASSYGRSIWKSDLRITVTEPGPNFNIAATSCSGIPVAVNNVTTNGTASTKYKWIVTPSAGVTYVSGTNDSSINPVLQFANQGTYSIELIAVKSRGGFCRTKKTNIINIGTGGSITHTTTADTSVCPGDTVAVGVKGMSNYTFEPNSFVSKVNDSNYIVFPPSATNYMIIGDISGGCFDTVYVNVKMNPFLAYSIAGNQKFCLGDSTTITVTPAAGTFDTVLWSPMTNITFNGSPSNVKIKPLTAGVVNYTITMKKAGLCNVNYVLPINAQSLPTYDARINGTFGLKSKNICSGDSVFLSEVGVPLNTWSPGTGLNMVTGDNVIAKPLASTTYYVKTSDTTVCPTTFDSLRLNVTPSPTIVILGGKDICIGMKTMMVATGAGPMPPASYVWSPTDSLSSISGDTVIANPTSMITYTVVGSNGVCSGSAQKTINVGTGTVILKYTGDTLVCRNTTAIIKASGADAYHWYPESAVNSIYDSIIQTYVKDSILLTLVGISTGCTDSIKIPVKIKPIPNIKLSADTNKSVCEGTKVKLTATGGTSYDLFPKYNFKTLSSSSFEVNPSRTTVYKILGTSSVGCKNSDSFIVEIDTNPKLNVTPLTKIIDKGETVNFTASGASNYTWSPNQFVKVDGDTMNNTLSVAPDSNFIYYLTGKTGAGCKSEALVIVYVKNGTGTNSINGKNIENILIYPNPSSDFVTIQSRENLTVSLVDMNGRVVTNFKKTLENHKLDVSSYNAGNYTMILDDLKGHKNTVKIAIQR